MSATETQTETQTQVKVQLTTQDSTIALPEGTGPILINADLRRYALSTLVNHLLETPQPIPLDFLINGTSFLRSSVGEYLAANGLSSETVLTAEYVRATLPPQHVASFPHEAWLSSVDALTSSSTSPSTSSALPAAAPGHERILTGAFDGSLRVWDQSGTTIASTPAVSQRGAVMSVKAARWLSATRAVSTGYDRTVRVWSHDEARPESERLRPQLELVGHTAFVNSLDVHAGAARVLSASDDGRIGVWAAPADANTDLPPIPAELAQHDPSGTAKRRRVSGAGGGAAAVAPRRGGPLLLLDAHRGGAARAAFDPRDRSVGYSVGRDRSLRLWDLAVGGAAVAARPTSNPLLSLAPLPDLGLVAAGSSARHIVLVDPRAAAARVAALTLKGHRGWVAALAADPATPHRLLSGSYDGTCRIWDLRAVRSDDEGSVGESNVQVPRKSEGKVFDVRWDAQLGLLSAGEDRMVHVDKVA